MVEAFTPPAAVLAFGNAVMAQVPASAVYARVDVVESAVGPLLMELELIEPALFLDHAPDGGAAFTRSILNALEKATA